LPRKGFSLHSFKNTSKGSLRREPDNRIREL
jgi:hypothetical protein